MEISKGNKTALIFGATGLVGSKILDFLLLHPSYTKIKIFGRRSASVRHAKLEEHIIDFDKPESYRHLLKGDDIFLCLGTTMQKAGSKEKFYKIDFTYSYEAAKMASEAGVNQLFLVSSVGADPNSLFFYTKVKGELEEALKKLPFWSVHLFQPSFLLGERNENRFGEKVAGKIGKFLDAVTGGLLMKYRPVEADVVAKAIVQAAQQLKPGIHVYPSHKLQQLASETDALLR